MTTPATPPELDEAARGAVEWAVLLRSGEMSADEQRDFDRWMSDSDRNRAAWQRLQVVLTPFARTAAHSAQAAREALVLTSGARRKLLRNGIGVVATLGGAGMTGYLVLQRRSNAQFAANFQTVTGERRNIVLADQTHLFIDAKSAVQVRAGVARQVLLRSGKLYADVAPDRHGTFFSIETSDGWVRTAEAALEVASATGGTRVTVRPARATVETLGGLRAILQPGDVVEFGRHSIRRIATSLSAGPAWIKGLFVASDVPLSTVIDALRPYYRGLIRISPEAGQRRVSGVFRLDDARQALDQISQTISVDVTTYANCVVIISAR